MINRRRVLQVSAGLLAYQSLGLSAASKASLDGPLLPVIKRAIPSSGELVPVMGMGTSRTFDTQNDPTTMARLTRVMQAFFNGHGSVIDSSPMYGKAETRVGDVLRNLGEPQVFAATKVWVNGKENGIAQMQQSARLMGVDRFDLIAVHNLKDWQTHLTTLKQWKAEGKVRYIGITASHGRYHDQLLQIMQNEPLDFVQFSYNMEDRQAEQRLLPLASDKGIATMINRPFQRGALFGKSRDSTLPSIASDIDCTSWGQFYLKFILGNPAVTCIIPATADAEHMQDNMQANLGRIPDNAQRAEMLQILESL